MNNITRILNRFSRRTLLISLAVGLLLLNVGRWLHGEYQAQMDALESRRAMLVQNRKLAEQADELNARLEKLNAVRQKVDRYFFTGESEERITSAMQLNFQALVGTAGLETESIRPIRQKSDRGDDNREEVAGPGEVAIKARLVGTLEEFVELLALLYRSEKYFRIESFTLTPYKRAGLKVYLELVGYFVTAPAQAVGEAAPATSETIEESNE